MYIYIYVYIGIYIIIDWKPTGRGYREGFVGMGWASWEFVIFLMNLLFSGWGWVPHCDFRGYHNHTSSGIYAGLCGANGNTHNGRL